MNSNNHATKNENLGVVSRNGIRPGAISLNVSGNFQSEAERIAINELTNSKTSEVPTMINDEPSAALKRTQVSWKIPSDLHAAIRLYIEAHFNRTGEKITMEQAAIQCLNEKFGKYVEHLKKVNELLNEI